MSFYILMECKMIKKIWQNKTSIKIGIPYINVAPNRWNALTPAIVYVSNDVTIPFISMTSKSQHEEPFCMGL